jgi:hypothetical protein
MIKNNRKIRIVFMPVFKSYSDPLILHYLHYYFDMELGFTFGNYEDSPKIPWIDRLPKNSLSSATSKRIDINTMNYVNQSLF